MSVRISIGNGSSEKHQLTVDGEQDAQPLDVSGGGGQDAEGLEERKATSLRAKVSEMGQWIAALKAANKALRLSPRSGAEDASMSVEGGAKIKAARHVPLESRKVKEGSPAGERDEEAAPGEGPGGTRAECAGGCSEERKGAQVATTKSGYGFVGKMARPKDLAIAEVTGQQARPVAIPGEVEGGGPTWSSQPVVGFRPIGYLQSCFLEKNGTPRQGNVAPTSRARLEVLFGSSPEHALQGLTAFSHVWVLFVFHDNGNKAIKALVHPPRLDGGVQGLFATRTPHRPNPIGLSLCRLVAVEGATLILSGCDVIHGTPILGGLSAAPQRQDVKPYIPAYDTHGEDACSVPAWISNPPIAGISVQFSVGAEEALAQLAPTFALFASAAEARAAIVDVLRGDPRSVHLRNKGDFSAASGKRFVFALDQVDVTASFDAVPGGGATVATVEEIVPVYSRLKDELRSKAAATAAVAHATAASVRATSK